MRCNLALLSASICFFILASCKKNDINPDEVRLLALERKDNSGIYKTIFDYDNSRRIIKAHFESSVQNGTIAMIAY